jgi:membrane-associated phospholipid phosphatase
MPSLHMAWAAWCALALWRASTRGWVRALALLYPCLTALAVVATGNHFLFDIFGGLLAIAAAVALTEVFMGIATRRSGSRVANSDLSAARPAYRVSQTCYEVPDQVD